METHQIDPETLHTAMIAGKKAWKSIQDGRRKLWADWLVIGGAFQTARSEAMYVAEANQPGGRRYNTEMGRLLAKYDLHDIGKTARAHLLRVMDHLTDVEEWRSRQETPDDFNHPTSVWQRYSKSSKAHDHKTKKKRDNSPAALIKELKAELEQLAARNVELEEEAKRKPEVINGKRDTQGSDHEAASTDYKKAWTTHCLPLVQLMFDRCDKYWTPDSAWGDMLAWMKEQAGELRPTAKQESPTAKQESVADTKPTLNEPKVDKGKSWDHTYSVGDKVFDLRSQQLATILKIERLHGITLRAFKKKYQQINWDMHKAAPIQENGDQDMFIIIVDVKAPPEAETEGYTRIFGDFCLPEEAERWRGHNEM